MSRRKFKWQNKPVAESFTPAQQLKARYRRARTNGSLAACNLSLETFPPEILCLLDLLEPDEKIWECVDLQKLDVSNNEIPSIPDGIGGISSLIVFKACNNQLRDLPGSLFDLPLKVLDVSKNQLEGLSERLGNLSCLVSLHIAGNRIAQLPDSLCMLRTLEILDAKDNQLRALPREIGRLSAMLRLHLKGNQLVALPDSIANLRRLQILEVDCNQLSDTPIGLRNLTNLTVLDFRQNRLASTPHVPKAEGLKQLFLGMNSIREIKPDNLTAAPNLATIDLHQNKLQSIPESIAELNSLTSLDIRDNELRSLPAALGYMKQLRRVTLDGNPLRSIRRSIVNGTTEALKKYLRTRGPAPACLAASASAGGAGASEFVQLKRDAVRTGTLSLRDHALDRLPPALFADDTDAEFMSHLRALDLSGNNFLGGRLPGQILYSMSHGNFSSLETLSLDNLGIMMLPPEIGHIANLRSLSLNRNALTVDKTSSALEWNNLRSIRTISLSHNKFQAVPNFVFAMQNLEELNVSFNQIRTIAPRWHPLQSLKTLNMSSNKLDCDLRPLLSLPALESLHVDNNSLRTFPFEIGLLPLKAFMISGNPQKLIRPGIIARGTNHILTALRNKLPHGTTLQTLRANNSAAASSASAASEGSAAAVPPSPLAAELASLLEQMSTLSAQLEDPALSRAKRYAVKKSFAKARAAKIRVERKIAAADKA